MEACAVAKLIPLRLVAYELQDVDHHHLWIYTIDPPWDPDQPTFCRWRRTYPTVVRPGLPDDEGHDPDEDSDEDSNDSHDSHDSHDGDSDQGDDEDSDQGDDLEDAMECVTSWTEAYGIRQPGQPVHRS